MFFDGYVKLVLLYIWNPLIESVHDLQQAAGLPKMAKALGVKRFSAGSFSESVRLFDPEQLKPIIDELAGQLAPDANDPRLAELKRALTLVDGTVLTALTRLAMVGWYLVGLATAQDLVAFVNRPDNTGVELRAKEALWKKLGY